MKISNREINKYYFAKEEKIIIINFLFFFFLKTENKTPIIYFQFLCILNINI